MRITLALALSLALHLAIGLFYLAGSGGELVGGSLERPLKLNVRIVQVLPVPEPPTPDQPLESSVAAEPMPEAPREERRGEESQPPSSGISAYWPMSLLDELPQVVLDADLESPEIQGLLSRGRVRATLLINSEGRVDSLELEGPLPSGDVERLKALLAERFAKAYFVPAKVKGRAVAAAIPITVGVRP